MIISSSGKEKWLPFADQSGAHEHDHKQVEINRLKNDHEKQQDRSFSTSIFQHLGKNYQSH